MRNLSVYLLGFLCTLVVISCTPQPTLEGITLPENPQAVARGKELVEGLAACGACHSTSSHPDASLSGGLSVNPKSAGYVAPNITPGEGGIKGWSVLHVMQALREAKDPEGKDLLYEAHEGMEWLSDADTLAIITYLATLSPSESSPWTGPQGDSFFSFGGLFSRRSSPSGYVPSISPQHTLAYGAYLTNHVARCFQCHNSPEPFWGSPDYLGGGQRISTEEGAVYVPPIITSGEGGIAHWGGEALLTYLKTGKPPTDIAKEKSLCPTSYYKNSSERDLKSIVAYIQSISPQP